MPTPGAALAALRNLGPASAELLVEAGITTPHELRQLGAVMAFKLVEHRHGSASTNLLYALHGALTDQHWASFSPDERARLREEAGLPAAATARSSSKI